MAGDLSLAPGTEIAGRYVVEASVGRGGMGSVYRVLDKVLGERVALKLMDRAGTDPASVERFRREVRVARRITHRNVARTFDIGDHEGVPFLTMELVQGASLASVLRDHGHLATADALAFAAEVSEGLAAAHEAEVVHRDLKPQNVLVDGTGRVTILDFGIARSLADPTLTAHGVTGTPAYMAPEQISGDPLDARTDLFALGVMLHQMLAGRLPRWGEPGDLLARLDRPAPDLFLDDQPRAVVELVARLLSRDPDQRPPSARDVGTTLRMLLSGLRGPPGDGALTTAIHLPTVEAAPSIVAPVPDAGRSLAVMPFRERDASGLGLDLAEGLVDALSRAQGLRVLSPSATARFGQGAEPQAVGRQLGVDLLIEGSVRRAGNSLHVTARCVDAKTGVQIWNERFEATQDGILELEDELGQRIAEALRFELSIGTGGDRVHGEELELYLAGRRQLRAGNPACVELLTRAVAAAPGFRPAVAALALARVRAAFASTADDAETRKALDDAVAAALAQAPELPDSHLAAGVLASQRADYGNAANHLRRAVTLAPTFALAQEYLGRLQCESGRAEEGVRRLELAMKLDPALVPSALDLTRYYLFRGQTADHERTLAEVLRRTDGTGVILWQLQARMAVWRGDWAALGAVTDQLTTDTGPGARMLATYAEVVLADSVSDELRERFAGYARLFKNPRFVAFCEQLAAEAWAARGDTEAALAAIRRSAAASLTDVEWLEWCPALSAVRGSAEFPSILHGVRQRARAIWGA